MGDRVHAKPDSLRETRFPTRDRDYENKPESREGEDPGKIPDKTDSKIHSLVSPPNRRIMNSLALSGEIRDLLEASRILRASKYSATNIIAKIPGRTRIPKPLAKAVRMTAPESHDRAIRRKWFEDSLQEPSKSISSY